MESEPKADHLYSPRTLATLGGASLAALIIPGVLGSVFGFNPRWLGLLVAELIAFFGLTQRPKRSKLTGVVMVVAIVNGFLIYSDSVGLNALHHGSDEGTGSAKAGIFSVLDPKPWWPPVKLVEAVRAQDQQLTEANAALGEADTALKALSTAASDVVAAARERTETIEHERTKTAADLAAAMHDLAQAGEMASDRPLLEKRVNDLRSRSATLDNQTSAAHEIEQHLAKAHALGDPSVNVFKAMEADHAKARSALDRARVALAPRLITGT